MLKTIYTETEEPVDLYQKTKIHITGEKKEKGWEEFIEILEENFPFDKKHKSIGKTPKRFQVKKKKRFQVKTHQDNFPKSIPSNVIIKLLETEAKVLKSERQILNTGEDVGNTPILLVEMYMDAAIKENSRKVPQKTKNRVATWSSNSIPGHISGKDKHCNSKRNTHPNVHSSTTYSNWDMEAT